MDVTNEHLAGSPGAAVLSFTGGGGRGLMGKHVHGAVLGWWRRGTLPEVDGELRLLAVVIGVSKTKGQEHLTLQQTQHTAGTKNSKPLTGSRQALITVVIAHGANGGQHSIAQDDLQVMLRSLETS